MCFVDSNIYFTRLLRLRGIYRYKRTIHQFQFFLALWCGSIGALLTFPGLRLARMQWDALKHSESSGVATVLLHAAFVAPLLLTTLWVKPLSRDYLTERVYTGMEQPM